VDVELVNWRSVVAPPGISAADRSRLVAAMEAMVRSPEWRALLDRYHWLDRFLPGRDFEAFAASEEQRIETILRKLGITAGPAATRAAAAGYPTLVLTGLAVTGLAALVQLRRRSLDARGNVPGGRWRPLLLVAAGMALDVVLLETAGFVLASAVLFWFVARAFDGHRPVRDAVFAVGVSVASYLLFVRVLKLSLPEGVLGGWL
jgi:hypothetical protein